MQSNVNTEVPCEISENMPPSDENLEATCGISNKLSQLPKIVTKRSIHRVHKELRDVNNNAYEPNIVAIGPYHHGKDHLKTMEEHKLWYFGLLLKRKEGQNVERYTSAINELEQEARDCYAEPISLNRAQFVEMLVLDGCFIIEVTRDFCRGDTTQNPVSYPTQNPDPIFQTQWIRYSLVRDLLLFENQIPFFVLCKLFDLIEGEGKHQMLIKYLLKFCAYRGALGSQLHTVPDRSNNSSRPTEGIKHLLNLVHNTLIPSAKNQSDNTVLDGKGLKAGGSNLIPSATELKGANDIKNDSANNQSTVNIGADQPKRDLKAGGSNFIPPATEFKGANVEFRAKQCDALFEVNFKNGIMEMPSLSFADGTESLLRNLVAFEQYFGTGQPNFITSYVILLDSLINTSKDVEILSEYNIIDNWLGDNEAVANIINRLADSVIFQKDCFVYAEMFDDVRRHYNKRRNRWMAMLRRDIFYSPWAYLSFFAALALLILAIVDVVCSVLQVVHK